jgi:hypothetical protein
MTGQPQPNRVSSLPADKVLPVLPDRRVQFWKCRTELFLAVTTRSLPLERHRQMAMGLPESQVQRGAQAPLQDWLELERNKGMLPNHLSKCSPRHRCHGALAEGLERAKRVGLQRHWSREEPEVSGCERSLKDQRSYVSGGVKQRMSSLALAGVKDQGQISKLLARLERNGLIQNTGRGQTRGAPNEWRLTPAGQKVERGIRDHQKQAA